MIDSAKYQAQASELSQKLWAIANDLRGNMDSTKFRNYILGTIFYSYLSERTEEYMQEILKEDGLTYEQAFSDADYRPVVEQWSIEHLGYIIKPENLFRELVRKIVRPKDDADRFSVEDYERAVNELIGSTMGQASEAAFSGLFNDMKLQDPDLGDTVAERTALIAKVIVKISEIDFSLSDSQFDVLGTAYMILIGLFASDAGKKSGEFFTPTGPSKLVATLATVGLDEAKTVGDCTCGSASMLLEVQKHLTTGRVGHFYGQENNATTYNLARMNMLMHGVDYQNFDIYKGDTLREDKYPKGGWFLQRLRRYEAKADGPGRTAGGNRLYSRCKDRGSESGAFCKGAERPGACAAWLHGQNGRGNQRPDPPCRAAPSGLPLAACRY